ncbi:MAG: hypothetical protein H7838_09880 [Magnetococcus sp. DMHC-8]
MSRPTSERGSLTLLAILLLVGLAVLGGSMGWLHLRGIDIAAEWLNPATLVPRSPGKLLDLGQRLAQNRVDGQCALPASPDYRLSVPNWGTVEARFQATADGTTPVTITATQGCAIWSQLCRITCMACTGWEGCGTATIHVICEPITRRPCP